MKPNTEQALSAESLPIDRWPLDELVPHAAPMVLLEKIVTATRTSMVATAVLDQRSPFIESDAALPAWWAVEYMAQAIATLAGLRERLDGGEVAIGYLTSVRRFSANQATMPYAEEATIAIEEVIAMDSSLVVFDCKMSAGEFAALAAISVYGTGDELGNDHSDDMGNNTDNKLSNDVQI